MPLEKIVIEQDRGWALWRITEEANVLAEQAPAGELLPDTLTHAKKKVEWLAGRVLLMELFGALSLPFQGVTKDEFGKPFATGYDYHISLSHSFPFVAALVDKKGPAGIDLEQPKMKLFRVAHRIFHREELKDAGSDLIKHCIYWCAKEALIKVYGKKDLTLAKHLLIEPFQIAEEGDIRGRILAEGTETVIPLHYMVSPGFVLVFNRATEL